MLNPKYQFTSAVRGKRGTQYILTPTTRELFTKYVRPLLDKDHKNYDTYIAEYPNDAVLLIRHPSYENKWVLGKNDDYSTLEHYIQERQEYWQEVEDFNTPEAIKWSRQVQNPFYKVSPVTAGVAGEIESMSNPAKLTIPVLGILSLIGLSIFFGNKPCG